MIAGNFSLGVAGAGPWGMNVVRACARLGILAAVCDVDPKALEHVRAAFPSVAAVDDYRSLLEIAHLDAVAIAVPARLHARFALDAIDEGLHVLVEKPLALCVADAIEVVEAARRANTLVAAGHVLLYHPAVVAMLAAIRSGAIGEVRHFRSRRLSWGRLRSHEDVWWSFAPHDVSVMLEVFKEEPQSVAAVASSFVRPEIADTTYADFSFSSGRTAHVEVSWIDPERTSRFDVFGSKGVLTFTDRRDGATVTLTRCGERHAGDEPVLWRQEPESLAVPAGEPLALEIEAFARAARGGTALPSGGPEALAVVRTLAMVHERCGRTPAEALA